MTSARHANIHIISVTNGWWSEKTRQKWENRTLYWVIYPEFKRQWLSKAGMNKCNSSLFFSVQIFDSTQQSSFIAAIKSKAKYRQHLCFVPKIHEGIFNGIDQSLSQAYLINFWISLKLSKGVETGYYLKCDCKDLIRLPFPCPAPHKPTYKSMMLFCSQNPARLTILETASY